MLDWKWIADHREEVESRLAQRGGEYDLGPIFDLDVRRKELIQLYDEGRQKQRQLSEVFRDKSADGAAKGAARDTLKTLSDELKDWESERHEVESKMRAALLEVPNLPDPVAPIGGGEEGNVEVRTWGEKPTYDFELKNHIDVGEALNILDFEAAARLSGARFALYRGLGARMERALMALMLDMHSNEHGYTEVFTPFLVLAEAMEGTGQLPKFADDAFKTDTNHYLIPTAEVPVTNMHRESIMSVDELPIRYTAYSSCFRREAGSYGKDVRGLTRVHQFQKVELVQFTKPEDSEQAHQDLTRHAEAILQRLGLHYRVVELCTGDIGFSAQRTYDLEVWLPAQETYREISSCSNFGDYQARRASIRFRREQGSKPEFVHTLNGSGLAIGRTVMAIIENYQQSDGSIVIPGALRPYMGGVERIEK